MSGNSELLHHTQAALLSSFHSSYIFQKCSELLFCPLVSFISLFTNKRCNCKSSFAFSVEKPGNKNRQTTHFILKALLPLRRWVWIAVSHWPLLSLCEDYLSIRAVSSGTFCYFSCSSDHFIMHGLEWLPITVFITPVCVENLLSDLVPPEQPVKVCAVCSSPGWW